MAVPVVVDMGGVSVSSRTHLRDVNTGLRIARTSHVPLALVYGDCAVVYLISQESLSQYCSSTILAAVGLRIAPPRSVPDCAVGVGTYAVARPQVRGAPIPLAHARRSVPEKGGPCQVRAVLVASVAHVRCAARAKGGPSQVYCVLARRGPCQERGVRVKRCPCQVCSTSEIGWNTVCQDGFHATIWVETGNRRWSGGEDSRTERNIALGAA
eukprot:178318-Rhodomonas_salina.3